MSRRDHFLETGFQSQVAGKVRQYHGQHRIKEHDGDAVAKKQALRHPDYPRQLLNRLALGLLVACVHCVRSSPLVTATTSAPMAPVTMTLLSPRARTEV